LNRRGLSYLRARYYDLGTGRFLSPDPFSGTLDSLVSRQKYQYAADTPTNASDPTGLQTLGELVAVESIRQLVYLGCTQAIIGAGALAITGVVGWSGQNGFANVGNYFAGFGLYSHRADGGNSGTLSKRSTLLTIDFGQSGGTNFFTDWLSKKIEKLGGLKKLGGSLPGLAELGLPNLAGINLVISSETLLTPGLFGSSYAAAAAVAGAYLAANGNFSLGLLSLPRLLSRGLDQVYSGDAYNAGGAQVSIEGFSFGFSVLNTQTDFQFGPSFSISIGVSIGWVIEVDQPDDGKPGLPPLLSKGPLG
jgi:RHS repeat-associated protein